MRLLAPIAFGFNRIGVAFNGKLGVESEAAMDRPCAVSADLCFRGDVDGSYSAWKTTSKSSRLTVVKMMS